MVHKKKPARAERKMMKSEMSKVRGRIIMVAITILLGLALRQGASAAEIDLQKDIYLFLHERTDLQEKAVNALVTYGFLKEKITLATPKKVGNVGDYMAMLWKPPEPDHIKIQRITRVEKTEPEEIKGLWRGAFPNICKLFVSARTTRNGNAVSRPYGTKNPGLWSHR